MRKFLAVLLLLLFICVPGLSLADGDTVTGEDLIYNGDFSLCSESADLPAGWELSAYTNDAESVSATIGTDEDGGAVIVLSNPAANDSRVCQTVSVQPSTCYRLSADILTEDVQYGTGASLSIDNYSIDGTYCYGENLFGSEDWQTVSLYFFTGEEQTRVCVALRLGGYGTTATGTAEFRNVTMFACTETSADVVDLATENGTVSNVGGSAEQTQTASANGMLVLALTATAVCALAYAWFYRRRLRYECETLAPARKPSVALAALLVAAFLLRLILSLIFHGHPTDLGCFMAWGNAMLNNGPGEFYTSGMFADYPPGYMYVCGALSWLCKILNISYDSAGMAFLFKLPSTIADLVGAFLLYRVARNEGLGENASLSLAGVFVLCPVLMFVSGAWGQIDSLLTLLLVLVILLFQKDKKISAGAVYGLAILLKPQALMLGPLLAVAYIDWIPGTGWAKRLVKTVLSVAAAVAVMFVLALPFQSTQPWYWLIEKYGSTASSYPYASIEAFNLASLLGGNWKSVDMTVFGVSYRVWGSVGIALSVVFASYLYIRGRKRSRGALYLCGSLMTLLIFTLGQYMHERYMLPALLLMLVAYAYYRDRRILIAFGGAGTAALLNATCAMYVVNHQAARAALYDAITRIGSLVTIFFAAYLAYVAVRIILFDESKPKLDVPKDADSPKSQARAGSGKGRKREAILPLAPTDGKLRYTRRDILYVLGITLVYGVVALTNLGSTSAPQTCWQADTPGETITVRFDQTEHVGAYSVYGNIDKGGTLLISADGYEETFEQTYDDMFRWKKVGTDFTASEVTLTLYSGTLRLNEMAFFDTDGNQIPVTLVDPQGTEECLFDEQDIVPAVPSYYNGMYFDELYHGRTAYEHLHNLSPYENSHPPLGKLLIMVGIAIFGMTPFGWRVVGALFGIGMLPILYAFGKRIFKNSDYALVCTTLFAFDFMHFTQTRIATIDVYSVFFILLMYYYMYRYITMNFFTDGLKATLKPLALSGLFFGIGAACKWTSIYAGFGLAVLLFGSLIARYREFLRVRAEGSAAEKARVELFRAYCARTLLWCCLFFIAVPLTVYFAAYTPYFIYDSSQSASYGFGDMIKTFWSYQKFMYNYHSTLKATHPYQSSWYSWPFTVKPMWYYFNSYLSGSVSTLTASGNPAVWWVSSIGAVILLVLRLTRRIKPDRALQIFCVGVCANYLPWVMVTRCTFIYHFFATVPFILMATVYLVQKLEQRHPQTAFVKWVWVGVAIAFFILLYPGISGLPVSATWAAAISRLPGGRLMYGA